MGVSDPMRGASYPWSDDTFLGRSSTCHPYASDRSIVGEKIKGGSRHAECSITLNTGVVQCNAFTDDASLVYEMRG